MIFLANTNSRARRSSLGCGAPVDVVGVGERIRRRYSQRAPKNLLWVVSPRGCKAAWAET